MAIMNRLIIMRLITRHSTVKNQQFHSSIRLLSNDGSSSSSDSSDSENDTPKIKPSKKADAPRDEESKKNTVDLLNTLLVRMSEETAKPKIVDRAIPKKQLLPKPVPKPTLEEKIVTAAKDVANTLGGDVEKTEVELLNKIFSAGTPKSTPTAEESSETSPKELNLSHLLSGMNVDFTPAETTHSDAKLNPARAARVQDLARKFHNIDIRTTREKLRTTLKSVNLYGGARLNFFESSDVSNENPTMKTWAKLEEDELKLSLTHPPENIYQEMIQWTEKGILWKFPIDNEIGMEEEANIHFSDHVFMERHLQGWCPKKGPIRHFMELVCVGLSKNPYMTVQEKKDHIMWYQDFFSSKQQLLKEVGAITDDIPTSNSTKQIEL